MPQLSMQQAVLTLKEFKHLDATYRFTHRDKHVYFTKKCADIFRQTVQRRLQLSHYAMPQKNSIIPLGFGDLALTDDELEWLRSTCPYFTSEYLTYLENYRFKPDQVKISFIPVTEDGEQGNIEIEARGLWCETIMWEVPLMACLSEIYFQEVSLDWDHEMTGETRLTGTFYYLPISHD